MADWEKKKKLLSEAYTDINSPASYGSLERLYEQVKKLHSGLEKGDVERFLLKEPSFTRNKPRRNRFARRRTIKKGPFFQLAGDLMDVSKLKSKNKNFTFILILVDVVTHYLVAIPLKSKSKQSMLDAFEFAFTESNIPVSKVHLLHTDKGLEFVSVKNFLEEKFQIKLIHSSSGLKSYYAERYIKELEKRLFRHLYALGSSDWFSILGNVVTGYNATPQKSLLNQAPVDFLNDEALAEKLKKHNALELLKHFKKNDKTGPFEVGDRVRYILKKKSQFDKAYIPSFSNEIETIEKKFFTIPNVYRISNHPNRKFYAEELSLVGPYKKKGEVTESGTESGMEEAPTHELIKTRDIADRTTRSGVVISKKTEYLIKNLKRPNQAATWMDESEYKALQRDGGKIALHNDSEPSE